MIAALSSKVEANHVLKLHPLVFPLRSARHMPTGCSAGCIEPWLRYSAACLPDQWIIAAGLIMQQFISTVYSSSEWILVTELPILKDLLLLQAVEFKILKHLANLHIFQVSAIACGLNKSETGLSFPKRLHIALICDLLTKVEMTKSILPLFNDY